MPKPPGFLELGPDLYFPLDLVTQPIAIMGVRRSGKSNAAAVMAEEMFDAGLPWVAIDPKGDWWGLRSSSDGMKPGLPIPIFGGLHGDAPLDPASGALMAELIFEHNLTCVLDVCRFTVAARARFLVAFGDRLFELHQADPQPRFIFLEEAHSILPQMVRQDQAHCVHTWTKIIAEGGAFGLGIGILDQRCQTVNKNGLTQVEAMIPMRTTSPQDRKAIHDWMIHHGLVDDIVESLPGMPSGDAWVSSAYWLPLHGQPAIQRKRFRQRRTYDSGATPVVGQTRRVATLADIDLAVLGERMAALVEKAAQDDPKALRARIAELERLLAAQAATPPAPAPDLIRLEAENASLRARHADDETSLMYAVSALGALRTAIGSLVSVSEHVYSKLGEIPAAPDSGKPDATGTSPVQAPEPAPRAAAEVPALPGRQTDGSAPDTASDASEAGDVALTGRQRNILTVLAQHQQDGCIKPKLAVLSGNSVRSSTFDNNLSSLRVAALITRTSPIRITSAGLSALGEWEPLPSGAALVGYWLGKVNGGAEREVLRVLIEAWPGRLGKAAIAHASGYSRTSSTLDNALSRLRTLQLIRGYQDDICADDTLGKAAKEPGIG